MSASYLEHLRSRLAAWPTSRSVTFLREGPDGMTTEELDFGQLDTEARRVASLLQDRVAHGGRALLLYPPGLEFLTAFLGCVYAGVIAVPAPVSKFRRSMDRVQSILVDADVRIVLTTQAEVAQVGSLLAGTVDHCLATDNGQSGDAQAWRAPPATDSGLVYLQYTSGSTSEPKGVMVTSTNLLHNAQIMRERWRADSESTMVGWVPHFHDMGLIGTLLFPLHIGARCAFTAPLTIVKRPVRWLDLVTEYQASITMAPDFAYDMCTGSVTDAQLSTLDLSTLRVVVNGAEPVRPATQEAFARRFAPAGFRPEMFVPCYGLAEATLLVSAGELDVPPTVRELDAGQLAKNKAMTVASGQGVRLVGHGHPHGFDLRVVAPDERETVPDGEVGEIWLRGPSVTAGYWNRPEITAAEFQARTADGEGPFLRTGDLGFVLDGELFVTGRLKDVIVVHGRNIYPQDVEFTVRAVHPALAAKPGAAFAVDTGREHVVLVQQIKPDLLGALPAAELTSRIRQAISDTFDVPYPSVVLVTQPVPRTTSGKVRRRATRELFLDNELAAIHEDLAPAVAAWRAAASGARFQ